MITHFINGTLEIVLQGSVWCNPTDSPHFLWAAAQNTLNIAHKAVYISLTNRFWNNTLFIIVTNASWQLLIIHPWFVLTYTPKSCYLVRVDKSELPTISSPSNTVLTGTICQQLQQKLPQLDWSSTYNNDVGWGMFKDTSYVCGRKQQNLQLLDILACNSANEPSFKTLTQTYLPNGP